MHIFKNVSQVIWDHINGKHDTIGYDRQDLKIVNCMPHLWIDEGGNLAPWVLSKQEKTIVKEVSNTNKNYEIFERLLHYRRSSLLIEDP